MVIGPGELPQILRLTGVVGLVKIKSEEQFAHGRHTGAEWYFARQRFRCRRRQSRHDAPLRAIERVEQFRQGCDLCAVCEDRRRAAIISRDLRRGEHRSLIEQREDATAAGDDVPYHPG